MQVHPHLKLVRCNLLKQLLIPQSRLGNYGLRQVTGRIQGASVTSDRLHLDAIEISGIKTLYIQWTPLNMTDPLRTGQICHNKRTVIITGADLVMNRLFGTAISGFNKRIAY